MIEALVEKETFVVTEIDAVVTTAEVKACAEALAKTVVVTGE